MEYVADVYTRASDTATSLAEAQKLAIKDMKEVAAEEKNHC